jgi:hypothetical protein
VTAQPNDTEGDVAAWGLTPKQRIRYYRRLIGHNRAILQRMEEDAERLDQLASRWLIAWLLANVLLLLLYVVVAT